MKRSIDLDEALAAEVDSTASLVGEKPSIVMRLAIRAGFPAVANRFQAPRPEGYFADAYKNCPRERREFEEAMAKSTTQRPER